jgi:apolipoprotein N-acyltransferase
VNLIGAILALAGSSGRVVLPLSAWLAPLFLLRFVRNGRAVPRLLAAVAVVYGIDSVTWWGMVPVPGPMYFIIMMSFALPALIPYLADRLIVRRPSGFAATLVFPSAWVVMEYVVSLVSPYGSWGLVAYTQVENLPLMQSASVTGLWGIGFLIAWFASVVNWAWERRFEWGEVRSGVLGYASVLAVVLLLGGARLALAAPTSHGARYAARRPPRARGHAVRLGAP